MKDDANPPILVASDRQLHAEKIARLLGEEFAKVHVSTDPKRAADDFELHRPAVLVLAFDALDKARRHFDKLCQPAPMARALPHKVVFLYSPDDMRDVYEFSRSGGFDDFVLFDARTDELRPLFIAVRRALRQVAQARDGAPAGSDFAAQARRLPVPDTLPATHPARMLRTLAERCPPLVLVVDDDVFQHKLIGQVLAAAGIEAVFATTAGKAMGSLQKQARRPDLILMDVSLPGVDGIEATRLLKAAPQVAGIPVIMITGVGGKNVVVESLKAGAADFVVKPLDRNVLLGKVRKLLYGLPTETAAAAGADVQ
jgi:PleD family two-component response regulator